MRGMIRRPLLSYAAEAVFEIPGLAEYAMGIPSGDRVELPPAVMTLMLGVGIGAIRGLIAQRTAGTVLESRPLPLINVSGLVSRLIYGDVPAGHAIPFGAPVCG